MPAIYIRKYIYRNTNKKNNYYMTCLLLEAEFYLKEQKMYVQRQQ